MSTQSITILASLTTIVLFAWGILKFIFKPFYNFIEKEQKTRKLYKLVWKKSSSLKPVDIMEIRGDKDYGFNEYYYPIQEMEYIKKAIQAGENVLVTGNPLAGKTRALYQALVSLDPPCDVIIPRLDDLIQSEFGIPRHYLCWRKPILVLDDLDKFTEKQNFSFLLQQFIKRKISIIATCRSGPEFDCSRNKMEREFQIFKKQILIPKITRDQAQEIADSTQRKLPDSFDGNIGSIFLELDAMKERYKSLTALEKGVLRSVQRLYHAGIYSEREFFSKKRVKAVALEKEGINMKEYEWKKLYWNLNNLALLKESGAQFQVEEAYLQKVIEKDFEELENFQEMITIFAQDPQALFQLGNKALEKGLTNIQIASYMKIAITAYNEALRSYTFSQFSMDYAITQNNLGNAYRTLAKVEDKVDNCRLAIKAFQEALKVSTLEEFPMDYAMTQNNLGTAYCTLAEVEAKADNCRLAIEAFQEALKVFTKEKFPVQYNLVTKNLNLALDFCMSRPDQP